MGKYGQRTLDGREDELIDKLSLKISDDQAFSAKCQRLFFDGSEILGLSNVGDEGLWSGQSPTNGSLGLCRYVRQPRSLA